MMKEPKKVVREAFCLIGKEGSTADGPNFIAALWKDANAHFSEAAPLVKMTEEGDQIRVWGAMTDLSRSFLPWDEEYSRGLYLAGVECRDDAVAPAGWVRWDVPGFEYLCVPSEDGGEFSEMLTYLADRNIPLEGAVQEFYAPEDGGCWLYFPIKRL